ncbi:MAG: peptide chain release factor N(5)-glutamine methyltransferase [Acidimicrobiales bacterium]
MTTWRELHDAARDRLGSEQEARWLVEEAAGAPYAPDAPAPERPARRFRAMLDRRAAGEPLQYVLGRWAFRRLDLMVDRRVLIPRPETEGVVGIALEQIADRRAPLAVDLGTGSGAIALSLALEHPSVEVWATDVSAAALDVARANAAGVGGRAAPRVRFAEGRWWAALPGELRGRVDLVVSNPPYLSEAELAAADAVVRDWEPAGALAAGPAGTEALGEILAGAPEWLAPGGAVVVELAPHQAGVVAGRLRALVASQ